MELTAAQLEFMDAHLARIYADLARQGLRLDNQAHLLLIKGSHQGGFEAGVECSQAQFNELLAACKALITYRDAAGAMGFQLEKADDFINQLRAVIVKVEGE